MSNVKSLWVRPTGAGGCYIPTAKDLDALMADDPFYDPTVPLSGIIFTDEPAKPDPFEQAEETNASTQCHQFLKDEENKKLEQPTTFYADHWRVEMHYKAGKWVCAAENQDSGETKSFTLANLGSNRDAAMSAAGKYLRRFNPPWKQLSQAQLIAVSRMASGGTDAAVESAMYTYLNYALAGKELEGDISAYPEYQPLCNEVCWYCFIHGNSEFVPEAREWMESRIAGRVVTISLLKNLFALWKEDQYRNRHGMLFHNTALDAGEQPETADTVTSALEDLSDETLAATYHQTVREIAKGRN